ncbi:hypothetical protein NLM16_27525 [Bradyrhizobium brasilense]|uniref:hypothetical protein n=1 Tax=Bradyrhizobium brasilense TaxID=1419277 RepID=UPI002877C88D|nr:hypothetical protein [Bradyrhizobium brasilense]MCP3417865.1 hypothetical protein [Bradyrhizobium brasilense]
MKAASEAFVDMDELAEGVGRYIAQLTGAEWGVVTAGSVAALALATAACIAGNEPIAITRLPRCDGLKNRVLIPCSHRFPYDSVIGAVGADLVPFDSLEALAELAESACMICFLARAEQQTDSKMSLEAIRERVGHTPIVVDAAGLSPGKPDPWLSRGATLSIYSGGKYLRGPQSTGLLLGSEQLARAAWANGPPHFSFGRAMKVGKEEIVGAVVALEAWLTPCLRAKDERKWLRLLRTIASNLSPNLLRVSIHPSSRWALTPRLKVCWVNERITSDEIIARMLRDFRIQLPDFYSRENVVFIDPFNIVDDEQARLIARSLDTVFRHLQSEVENDSEAAAPKPSECFAGLWSSIVKFAGRVEEHVIELTQERDTVSGTYRGDVFDGPITGFVLGNELYLVAKHQVGQMEMYYCFEGRLRGRRIEGIAQLGAATPELRSPSLCKQFGNAAWTARPLGAGGGL